MKKYRLIVIAIFAATLACCFVCCSGKASSNETSDANKNDTLSGSTENNLGVITLTESNFDDKIKNGVALVDFWATWCPPCRMESPVVEKLNKEMAGKVKVYKLDIDHSPAIADRYGVQNIPTLIIFKGGKPVMQFVGFTSKEDLETALDKEIK